MSRGPVGPALLAGTLALSGCGSSSAAAGARPGTPPAAASQLPSAAPTGEPVPSGRAPRLTAARLVDRVEAPPSGEPVRTTTWQACFRAAGTPGPGSVRWEAQPLTTEGAGSRLRPLSGRCLELVVARAADTPGGRASRAEQLFTSGALAYRVRAVRTDRTVSPWSEPVRVGTVRR